MIVDHPELVIKHAASAMSMLCSYFIQRSERSLTRSTFREDESLLIACIAGIDKLLNSREALSRKQVEGLEVIIASSWSAITCWIEDINNDVYLRSDPEMKVQYQRCLLRVCSIIAVCSELEVQSNIPAMLPIVSTLVELWFEGEIVWISEKTSVCFAFFIASKGSKGVGHPTEFFAELGLDPSDVVDLALHRLMEFKDKKCAREYVMEFRHHLDFFVGLSSSPNPAFCNAIAERRVFAIATSLCRKMRKIVAKTHDAWEPAFEHMHVSAVISVIHGIGEGSHSVHENRCLAQALRKGFLELVLTTMVTLSLGEVASRGDRDVAPLKRLIFVQLPHLLMDRLVAAAAGYGLSYVSGALISKLSKCEFWPDWLKLEQLILDRFAVYSLLRSLNRYGSCDCSNVCAQSSYSQF